MEKKKTTAIDNGFLLLYDWLPALQMLSGTEVKTLLLALIERQRNGTPIPKLDGMMDVFAGMIEPTIKRRLEGARAATAKQKQDAEASTEESLDDPLDGSLDDTLEATPEGTLDTCVGDTLEASKEKQSKEKKSIAIAEQREAEQSASVYAEAARHDALSDPPLPDSVTAPPPAPRKTKAPQALFDHALSEGGLTEADWTRLRDGGLSDAYVNERLERASRIAASRGIDVVSVLLDWWTRDKHKYVCDKMIPSRPTHSSPQKLHSSFDDDDFMRAAIERALQWDGR